MLREESHTGHSRVSNWALDFRTRSAGGSGGGMGYLGSSFKASQKLQLET